MITDNIFQGLFEPGPSRPWSNNRYEGIFVRLAENDSTEW